jgi:hypothetical protein
MSKEEKEKGIEGLKLAVDVQIKLNVISKPLGAKLADAIRLIKIALQIE